MAYTASFCLLPKPLFGSVEGKKHLLYLAIVVQRAERQVKQ
jgi:hypothetical protein